MDTGEPNENPGLVRKDRDSGAPARPEAPASIYPEGPPQHTDQAQHLVDALNSRFDGDIEMTRASTAALRALDKKVYEKQKANEAFNRTIMALGTGQLRDGGEPLAPPPPPSEAAPDVPQGDTAVVSTPPSKARSEPVLIGTILISVVLLIANIFNYTLTYNEMNLLTDAVEVFAPIIAGLIIRQTVTPNAKLEG